MENVAGIEGVFSRSQDLETLQARPADNQGVANPAAASAARGRGRRSPRPSRGTRTTSATSSSSWLTSAPKRTPELSRVLGEAGRYAKGPLPARGRSQA